MGDLGSTRAEGVASFERLIQGFRRIGRDELSKEVNKLEYTIRHFLEILSSTPGN